MKIQLAEKSDKKSIKRFYKNNNYSASFMGNDTCYLMKLNDEIIAAVVISNIDDCNFLHALVVNNKYQHKGLASQLLKHSLVKHSTLYCFADRSLNPLYSANNYIQIDPSILPEQLQTRFFCYHKKNNQLSAFRACV
ncbi:GNAT family N-acetyltransferase [Thalassomonas sp. M1454]|uniref:GNAT family N-acetyltransferase n=1 Tax=Thalassomonas sp. M1454 TaxID=2594477 RepID=UPI00117FE145|nr:GNAT family N-acetyltransferase [Thalassomonas sp. M1454]TRX56314.1 GNAT family N-acetyltransferase [Thalassomonas sp. M1454]